jgi:polyisoprenoid-binding protein YceI
MRQHSSAAACSFLLALALVACGGSDQPATSEQVSAPPAPATGEPLTGMHTFQIVPAESKASYHAREEFFELALSKFGIPAGWGDVVGTTQAVEGQFQLDTDRPGSWLGDNQFSVRMDTFETEREMRDNWIRENENGPYLNKYPVATFKAEKIHGGPASYQTGEEFQFNLTGPLTIREIARPTTFAIRARLSGDTLTGKATTQVLLSDFGIPTITFYNTLTVSDPLGLEVEFTARAQSAN